jgi:hypothetical protein
MGMRAIIIDTAPKDMRNQDSINLGLEIVSKTYNAFKYHWYEKVEVNQYDTILFNVIYPTNILNIVPFLRLNKIEPLRNKRKSHYIIAGGQGINHNGILNEIVDETFTGELDYEENKNSIITPVISRNGNTVIELTRGCKYKCTFCEYSHVCGGKYREKDFDLLKEQIDEIHKKKKHTVNFLSANFLGYSRISELLEYVTKKNMRIVNSDANFNDLLKVIDNKYFYHKVVKMGIESFDENTRTLVHKKISDEKLKELFTKLVHKMNYIHCYLIYGLPGDNYDKWFEWIEWLGKLRRTKSTSQTNLFGEKYLSHDKTIRFEFNITNFEPCNHTPLAFAPEVNFTYKDDFLKDWFKCLIDNGFLKPKGDIDYKNAHGRMGRKEYSYKMLMELKNSGSEITDKIINCFPNGVSRSILDKEAYKFLNF